MHNWRKQLQLIWYKAYSDLLAEASRGSLGLLWWVLEPLLYLGAFYVVFELAFKRGGDDFIPFLLIGLTSWKWFASSVANANNSIAMARGLISQVYVPKIIFPLSIVCVTSFKFLIIFSLLLIFVMTTGYAMNVHWLALPLILLLQLLVVTGSAALVAAMIPVLPDLKLIVDNALLLMFFMSGIFFDLSQLEGTTVGSILALNPMLIVIDSYRAILLEQQWPDWNGVIYVLFWSIAILATALKIHKKLDRVYPRFV